MKKSISILLLSMVLTSAAAQETFLQEDSRVENQSELQPGEDVDEKIKNNFFLKAEVSKTDCFVGECIMASFKAYSRLDANSQVVKRPSLTGFSVIEMVDAYNTLPETEEYNGIFYNTHLIRKVQLFPLQAGEYTLEAAEVESIIQLYNVEKPARKSLRDYFRSRSNSSLVQKHLTLQTPDVKITVKPLPEQNQPEDFTGGVGQFSAQMRIVTPTPMQFQPVIVQLVISGTGNLPLITDPEIKWPVKPGGLEPQVEEQTNKYSFPLSGTKTFEYSLPANDTGTFTIPAVQFSYFDPSDKKYKTTSSKTLTYTVSAADNKLTEVTGSIQTGRKKPFPVHYVYFGIIALAIIIVVIFQIQRGKKE